MGHSNWLYTHCNTLYHYNHQIHQIFLIEIQSIHHCHTPWVCTVSNHRPCWCRIGTNNNQFWPHHFETQNRWNRDRRGLSDHHHRGMQYCMATHRIAQHMHRLCDGVGKFLWCGRWLGGQKKTPSGHKQHGTGNRHCCGQSKNARNHPRRRCPRLPLRGTCWMILRQHGQRNNDILVVRGAVILDGLYYYFQCICHGWRTNE